MTVRMSSLTLSLLLATITAGGPLATRSIGQERRVEFAIVIHGGAGAVRKDAARSARRTEVLGQALDLGIRILDEGGTSLDAVESVIRLLEDAPEFNAGRGAVRNAEGAFELDATLMDGRDRSCGAVGGVRTVRNPISLARLVMTETPHVLLSGAGADAFAKAREASPSVELVGEEWFSVPDVEAPGTTSGTPTGGSGKPDEVPNPAQRSQFRPRATESWFGTVGCVALDRSGHLAAGTSTGGLKGKLPGRLGDSPIPGAGTYADDATCAVSCTGVGEDFIRAAAAYDVSARMKYLELPLDEAMQATLANGEKPLRGGMIAVDSQGRISLRFTTAGMARAAADSTGRREAFGE